MPAIVLLASQIIPLLITAGMDIAPVLERLLNANSGNVTDSDYEFLHDQRRKALAIINDRSRDVPRP